MATRIEAGIAADTEAGTSPRPEAGRKAGLEARAEIGPVADPDTASTAADAAASVTAGLARHARRAPSAPALTCGETTLSYGQLDTLVSRIAALLVATPAGAIALDLPNGALTGLLFLAVARAGREAQMLDPGWPRRLRDEVVAALRPALVVSGRPDGAASDLRLDPETAAEALPGRLAAALGLDLPATAPALPEPDPALPFYVGFTSGSTGVPKGYRRSHRSWSASFAADAREFGIGPGDVVLAPGALSHSLFLYALVHGLHAGAHVLLGRRFQPRPALAMARRHRASVIYGVPTQLALLLDALEAEGRPLEGVRLVLSSGAKWFAPERARLARLVPGAGFAEFYGASELSFVTVAKDREPVPEGSVGRPFTGVEIAIRDRAGRRRPAGRIGQVFVESPFLFDGYAMGSDADILRHGPALSVGDAGFLDPAGFLHLVGRARRMIVTSGKNLYPEEVERLLERHPAVRAACVLGAPDRKRGERLLALLALADGPAPTQAELIADLKPHLPLFKIPRRYAVVDDWPLTASGKSDFAALARLAAGAVRPLA